MGPLGVSWGALGGGVPIEGFVFMTTSISTRANMSRTTDRNLNNLGKRFKFLGSLGSRKVCGVPKSPLGVVGGEGWSIEGFVFMTTSISSRANVSRSTDRNLDNFGKSF